MLSLKDIGMIKITFNGFKNINEYGYIASPYDIDDVIPRKNRQYNHLSKKEKLIKRIAKFYNKKLVDLETLKKAVKDCRITQNEYYSIMYLDMYYKCDTL